MIVLKVVKVEECVSEGEGLGKMCCLKDRST